jgi:site-specific recombinase XerD
MNGEAKSESFLTHLAWDKDVSPSTQNQVMKVLVFLYKQVLKKPLGEEINAVRAIRKPNVLVVMTREEVARVITLMEGTPQLIVKLLYGSGLRIIGALRLLFQNHLSRVRMIYEHDLMNGYGEVYLPDVLSRKYPNAAKEWNWH